jgi:hypothetical protein
VGSLKFQSCVLSLLCWTENDESSRSSVSVRWSTWTCKRMNPLNQLLSIQTTKNNVGRRSKLKEYLSRISHRSDHHKTRKQLSSYKGSALILYHVVIFTWYASVKHWWHLLTLFIFFFFVLLQLNFLWSLLYNCLTIQLSAGLFYPLLHTHLPPTGATLAMALSSTSNVLSSLSHKEKKGLAVYRRWWDRDRRRSHWMVID